MKKTRKANLPDSDKILNFRESLEPYHLENDLKGYYTATEILNQFKSQLTANQIKKLKELAHPGLLQTAHLFVNDNNKIRPVNDQDVKRALQKTLRILKRSDQ